MTITFIDTLPAAILRKKASPVSEITEGIEHLIKNMWDVVDEKNAVGLAAPQLGINKAMLVWNVDGERGYIINPVIEEYSSKTNVDVEGCLSIPNVFIPVERSNEIIIRGIDLESEQTTLAIDSSEIFLSRVLQHEVDHLNGILMIDRAHILEVPDQLRKFRKSIFYV